MQSKAERLNVLMKEMTELQAKHDAVPKVMSFNEFWDEKSRLIEEQWKIIGQRLTMQVAKELDGQAMYRILKQAEVHLKHRVAKFNRDGKLTRVIEGPYSCRDGWLRAIVRVNGRRYGWYTISPQHWTTGDDLDKMAAASAIRRRWGPATHVVEIIEDLATVPQYTNPLHSWGCCLIEGRLYFTPHTSVAWEDVKDGQTFEFKNRKAKLLGEASGPYTGPVWRDSSNPQMIYTDGAYWKEEAD